MSTITPFDKHDIVHIRGVDHPESIGVGPDGRAYTTGTGCQVYRLDLEQNTADEFASTEARCLGTAVDADGTLYAAHTGGDVLKITTDGDVSVYAAPAGGERFLCTNYPAFDRQGRMYLSDSGDWSGELNGRIYRIEPGGGEAIPWFPEPVDTPNAIALDAEEKHLYFVETFGSAIARIPILPDGSAGALERVEGLARRVLHGMKESDRR